MDFARLVESAGAVAVVRTAIDGGVAAGDAALVHALEDSVGGRH